MALRTMDERADKRKKKHVVMLVANDVSSDSRVQKVACAASEAGYRVTVVGRAKTGGRSVEERDGARIVRVPVAFSRLRATESGPPVGDLAWLSRCLAAITARIRRQEESVARIDAELKGLRSAGTGCRIAALRAHLRGRQVSIKLLRVPIALQNAARAARWSRPGGDEPDREIEGRKHRAVLEDYEVAYRAELQTLKFDLVHAHDATTIGCAANAVMATQETSAPSRLVYDAHEYARGLSNLPVAVRNVNVDAEQASIGTAEAVVTVSPVLAQRLQRDHALTQLPDLVLNAPLAAAFDPDSPLSVRASVGLAEEVPLAVYAGVVKPLRGVDTVVRALPLLPGLHVAVVVNAPKAPAVKALVSAAERAGCAQRLHILPYVDQDQVINYLRTADVGLYPLLRSGNTELAWPTKIFEYLHAGLPMVVSDMPSMSQLVTEQRWGEVFKADDHESFAAAMQRVLAHPAAYDVGLRDKAVRERFSWERQARTLVDTYDRLLLDHGSEDLKRA
jgi:glycosyltransferase involved in cell wall biosynthesis